MNQAQRLLLGLYSRADNASRYVYLKYRNGFAAACWGALLIYALMGGINALLCAWALLKGLAALAP